MIPIFRIFDEHKAKLFYIEFLEFTIDWEHRFADDLPLYLQVSREGVKMHLSEHHGDCCPGAAVRIEVSNIVELHAHIQRKKDKYARPGLEQTPWGTQEMSLTDPFGNKLIFYEVNKQ